MKCYFNSCFAEIFSRGFCRRHYHQARRQGAIEVKQNRHGMMDHPLYGLWRGMRNRCNNPNYSGYEYYGGRGVRVCARWDNFSLFVKDMGERPAGMTLDRINTDGDYRPENCRWATVVEQNNNKRPYKRRPDRKEATQTCQG